LTLPLFRCTELVQNSNRIPICAAYLSLLFGISLSNQLPENYVIKSIGVCSFGIYLIHHLLIEFIRPFINKIYPISIDTVPVLKRYTIVANVKERGFYL
ncbi:MAG: hypothetical protein PUQ00_30410, partial [Nostoc sp. S13]|nr:hypothetical protein [Nostoc sp. S13]